MNEIQNLSSITFFETEIEFLKKSLKFKPQTCTPLIKENAINFLNCHIGTKIHQPNFPFASKLHIQEKVLKSIKCIKR